MRSPRMEEASPEGQRERDRHLPRPLPLPPSERGQSSLFFLEKENGKWKAEAASRRLDTHGELRKGPLI